MDKKSKTEQIRIEMTEYLKSKKGEKVRRKDIVNYLLESENFKNFGFTIGMINGVFNKLDGVSGHYIPIKNVVSVKEGGKAYYKYTEENTMIQESKQLYEIGFKLADFEEELKKQGYLGINLINLNEEELKTYLAFIEQFKKMKNLFTN